jgi:tetratricopeptide (TPR) repeat protein
VRRAVFIAALGAAACGGTVRAPEPVVGPTGYVYPLGTPPTGTRYSQTGSQYFREENFERALELALEGVEADPTNPVHYLLAGMAYMRLSDFVAADSMFDRAQSIYPAYELDIEPQREAGWGEAFNAGLAAYADGDVEGTITHWRDAIALYDLRPAAHRNLGGLLATEGRYDEAIQVYRDALAGMDKRPATTVLTHEESREREEEGVELEEQLTALLMINARYDEAEPLLRKRLRREPESVDVRSDLASVLSSLGRESEAREIYSALLSEGGLQTTQLFNLGVGLFRAQDFAGAEEAFRRLTELQPQSRDAWFNRANALFAMESWEALGPVGERLLALDPLGKNALLIAARARLETGDRDGAVEILGQVDAAPVYLEGPRVRNAGAGTTVEGRVTGNVAPAGSQVELRFSFFGDGGVLVGTATTTLSAPAQGESENFVVTFDGRALAYRYELVIAEVPQS